MEISLDKLKSLMDECYVCGYSGSLELMAQDLSEILKKHDLDREVSQYKIWSIEELRNAKDGTIFHHLSRGRCFVTSKSNGVKYMQFRDGKTGLFNQDGEPWDKPMKIVLETE